MSSVAPARPRNVIKIISRFLLRTRLAKYLAGSMPPLMMEMQMAAPDAECSSEAKNGFAK